MALSLSVRAGAYGARKALIRVIDRARGEIYCHG